MSTISIQAPLTASVAAAAGERAASTRLRITTRGRRLLAVVAAAPVVAGVAALSLLAGGTAVASGESAAPVAFETVTVLPGDTLWSIAAETAPDVDPREVIDDIKRLNNLSSGMIQVGTSIAIPTAYSD